MTGKILLLMRHAKAERGLGLPDFDRPLAPRGWTQSAAMAELLAARGACPDLVLCSTAMRARETLDGLGPFLAAVPKSFERRLYGANSPDLLDIVREQDQAATTILVIAHNPGMAHLTLLLATPGGGHQPDGRFPTGSVARFAFAADTWHAIRPQHGTLEEMIVPPKAA